MLREVRRAPPVSACVSLEDQVRHSLRDGAYIELTARPCQLNLVEKMVAPVPNERRVVPGEPTPLEMKLSAVPIELSVRSRRVQRAPIELIGVELKVIGRPLRV